jgi:hypothetical protein
MARTLREHRRWALIFEPCDFWVGVFYDRRKRWVYVGVPTLVLRYRRRPC